MSDIFNSHPYNAECNCKLCDMRRAAAPGLSDRKLKRLAVGIVPLTPATWQIMIGREKERHTGQYLNAYVCEKCSRVDITVDRDCGTTPAFIVCPNCINRGTGPGGVPAMMQSVFYRLSPGMTEKMATFEFYRPTYLFYLDIGHVGTRRHIERGGLLMRRIGSILPEGHEAMMHKNDG